jgi:hypothetical protein
MKRQGAEVDVGGKTIIGYVGMRMFSRFVIRHGIPQSLSHRPIHVG